MKKKSTKKEWLLKKEVENNLTFKAAKLLNKKVNHVNLRELNPLVPKKNESKAKEELPIF